MTSYITRKFSIFCSHKFCFSLWHTLKLRYFFEIRAQVDCRTPVFLLPLGNSTTTRDSRMADPPWKTQSGPNLLLDQKWTTGGDRGPNFEKKLWTKIKFFRFLTCVVNLRCKGRYFTTFKNKIVDREQLFDQLIDLNIVFFNCTNFDHENNDF